jgi:phospholipid transport system substrate-binding protein
LERYVFKKVKRNIFIMFKTKNLSYSLISAALALSSSTAIYAQSAAPSAAVQAASAPAVLSAPSSNAAAETRAPDVLVKEVSSEVLDAVKSDSSIRAGDVQKISVLVDAKVMPHMNFQRMTASAVGRNWRQATPDQQKRLQEEFKTLLVRTYAGALGQVKDHTISLRPMRSTPTDKQVVVRTEVRGKGEPIQLDYRMEKTDAGWKIYDMNILGVWLVENYRSSFTQEINAGGIDKLIAKLAERNKASSAADQAASAPSKS